MARNDTDLDPVTWSANALDTAIARLESALRLERQLNIGEPKAVRGCEARLRALVAEREFRALTRRAGDLPPELVEALGTVTDKRLALVAKVSQGTIRRERVRRGIPSWRETAKIRS